MTYAEKVIAQLALHYGQDAAEDIFEHACRLWADRVPWERALDQAEALVKDRRSATDPGTKR